MDSPREMQRMRKMCLNCVYEMQGLRTATDYYLEQVAILGSQPVPEYEAFSKATMEKGLKGALAEAQARYEGLDG